MKRVAINGFGRIGRTILRAFLARKVPSLDIVAINDISPIKTNLHLFRYDSVYGRFENPVTLKKDCIDFGAGPIQFFQEQDPQKLPWKDLNIDVVLECSGKFLTHKQASLHIQSGVKKVVISAPTEDADIMVVFGVNQNLLSKEHQIISNASCTTNCLAPIVMCLHKALGIERGHMTTIHSYTADQRLIDSAHSDLRRARSAALSMIPSSTGAAKSLGIIFKDLKGKIDGTAVRVPTPNVSLVDFTFVSKKPTTITEVNQIFIEASSTFLKNILSVEEEPLVSIDFNQNPHSAIVDLNQTHVVDHMLCRVLAWYDNEYGFSSRMLDLAQVI